MMIFMHSFTSSKQFTVGYRTALRRAGSARFNEKNCKHCALVAVRRSQKFHPAANPLPGGADSQSLISWRWSLPSPTDPVWWGSMHAISSYRGNRPTTNTHTQTGPLTIHCTAASLARSVKIY